MTLQEADMVHVLDFVIVIGDGMLLQLNGSCSRQGIFSASAKHTLKAEMLLSIQRHSNSVFGNLPKWRTFQIWVCSECVLRLYSQPP